MGALLKISSILAFIFALVGAILLVATPWSYWWYRYEGGGYVYYGSGRVTVASWPYGIFIGLASLLLFTCATISILTLTNVLSSRSSIIISLVCAIIVLIMIIIGAILTRITMQAEGLYWSFGPAFFGGIVGSILTIIFTIIMIVAQKD